MRQVFIYGPTASGKSDLAMRIADKYGGEIICADSQTLRRGMDIGTAKPTLKDRENVTHHMLDIIEPYDRYSVAEFKKTANSIMDRLTNTGTLPIVVGGTGLYVDSLLYDFKFRESMSPETREELESMTVPELQGLILGKGISLPKNTMNPRHLIRTIESDGQLSSKGEIKSGAIVVGIDPGKETLQDRIDTRVQLMLDEGLLDELEHIIGTHGIPPDGFDPISYRILMQNRISEGNYNVDKIKEQLAASDRQYAKKQRVWLKRSRDIKWFEQPNDAFEYIDGILQNS